MKILETVKRMCDIDVDSDEFDTDLIIHTNSVFSALTQMGIGPENGFSINDGTEDWSDYIDDIRLESVKTYVGLKVKTIFDPPSNQSIMNAYKSTIDELEWRLTNYKEV